MYKLSHRAADDFEDIYSYTLLNFGVIQADGYTDDLEKTLQILCQSPMMGRKYSKISKGLRRLDHRHHAIFYHIRQKDIFIVRILHQQMEPMQHCFDI